MLARLLDLAAVGIAADSLGGAQRALEMAVEYSQVREQFGRKIGSFQALKHIAAEMVADIEPARSLVWYAAYACDRRPRDAARAAAMAKASLGDVYSRDRPALGRDPRRHRLHLGVRPAALVQARAHQRDALRRPVVPPRAGGPARAFLTPPPEQFTKVG